MGMSVEHIAQGQFSVVEPPFSSKREKTRLQLIEAGIALLAKKSMDGASIDEVVNLAGVARGTFYNYFSDREALLRAISQHLRNQLNQELFDCIPKHYDVAQRTACIVYGFVDYAVNHPDIGWALIRIGGSAHWLQPENYSANVIALERYLRTQSPVSPVQIAMHYIEGAGLIAIRRRLEQVINEANSDQLLFMVLRGLFSGDENPECLQQIGKQFVLEQKQRRLSLQS